MSRDIYFAFVQITRSDQAGGVKWVNAWSTLVLRIPVPPLWPLWNCRRTRYD